MYLVESSSFLKTTFHQRQDVENTGIKLPCISISILPCPWQQQPLLRSYDVTT